MALQVTKLVGKNETGQVVEIDATGLVFLTTSSKGNVQLISPDGKKLNFESGDNEVHKPASKIQLDTNHYADDNDKKKVKISVICDKAGAVEGMNIECAGIDFETAKADTTQGWIKNQFRLRFKGDNALDDYADVNMHFRSLDLRARSLGDGTGGGIAVQIAGRDSGGKVNKFKIETDQTADVDTPNSADIHCGEGGKGIEIGTINPLFTSLYTASYRFKANSPIYAVSRGAIETTSTGKKDYPTQADDSKDIITSTQKSDPLTWNKLYQMYKWAKQQGFIPSDRVDAGGTLPGSPS